MIRLEVVYESKQRISDFEGTEVWHGRSIDMNDENEVTLISVKYIQQKESQLSLVVQNKWMPLTSIMALGILRKQHVCKIEQLVLIALSEIISSIDCSVLEINDFYFSSQQQGGFSNEEQLMNYLHDCKIKVLHKNPNTEQRETVNPKNLRVIQMIRNRCNVEDLSESQETTYFSQIEEVKDAETKVAQNHEELLQTQKWTPESQEIVMSCQTQDLCDTVQTSQSASQEIVQSSFLRLSKLLKELTKHFGEKPRQVITTLRNYQKIYKLINQLSYYQNLSLPIEQSLLVLEFDKNKVEILQQMKIIWKQLDTIKITDFNEVVQGQFQEVEKIFDTVVGPKEDQVSMYRSIISIIGFGKSEENTCPKKSFEYKLHRVLNVMSNNLPYIKQQVNIDTKVEKRIIKSCIILCVMINQQSIQGMPEFKGKSCEGLKRQYSDLIDQKDIFKSLFQIRDNSQ